MPGHHADKHHAPDDERSPGKKSPGKGPKEKDIAATLTAAAVALAGPSATYPSLDAAGDAVAAVYAKMVDLVARAAASVVPG